MDQEAQAAKTKRKRVKRRNTQERDRCVNNAQEEGQLTTEIKKGSISVTAAMEKG